MRLRTIVSLAAVAAILALLAIAVTRPATQHEIGPADLAALRRMDAYCAMVRSAFEQDLADLESDDSHRRASAIARFLEPIALHSGNDYALCTDDAAWLDPAACKHEDSKDPTCLAKLARVAVSGIRIAVGHQTNNAHAVVEDLRHLRAFCIETTTDLETFAHAYEREDEVGILTAEQDMSLPLAFDSGVALRMCSSTPPDLSELNACHERHDDPCIARVLRGFEQRIYVPDTR
jgi:hypothetical protein